MNFQLFSISGTIGFVLCSSDGPAVDFEKPVNPLDTENNGVAKGPPKFYNSQVEKETKILRIMCTETSTSF